VLSCAFDYPDRRHARADTSTRVVVRSVCTLHRSNGGRSEHESAHLGQMNRRPRHEGVEVDCESMDGARGARGISDVPSQARRVRYFTCPRTGVKLGYAMDRAEERTGPKTSMNKL
jgi:hypothetical protein